MSSLVSGSRAPGPMTCLRLSQVRLSRAGSCAMAFQKLLIQSILRVAMMSSKTARTSGDASWYSMNANVGIRVSAKIMMCTACTKVAGSGRVWVVGVQLSEKPGMGTVVIETFGAHKVVCLVFENAETGQIRGPMSMKKHTENESRR